MIAAAERARDMNYELLASVEMLNEAMTGEAGRAAEAAAAQTAAADAAGDVARANAEAAAATDAAGNAASDAAARFAADDAAMRGAADAATDTALAEAEAAIATRAAGDAALASVAKTDASRLAIGRWGLSWNALHWIIAGGAELLAVTLPAAVAAGAGAFVLYQGAIEQVGFRLEALYGTTEATAAMIGKTTGDVLGLGHAFQTAQNAANPIAYQLLGEYIDAAKSHMVDLAGAGLDVDRALGELGAKIDVDLIQQGGQLNSLLANMVSDLIEIGQVFGNLGHAVLNLAADMPGLAEVLLKIADAASRVVLWVSELPAPIITTFMVFEEFSRWGGLVVTILGKLGLATSELSGGLFSLSRFSGILANVFLAIPQAGAILLSQMGTMIVRFNLLGGASASVGRSLDNLGAGLANATAGMSLFQIAAMALVAGAIGFMIYKLQTAKSAAQEFADSLQEAVAKASNVQVTGVLLDNMALLAQRTDEATAADQQFSSSLGHTQDAGHAAAGVLTVLRDNQSAYSGALSQTSGQLHNVISGAETLSKAYGGSLAQSLALADAAGVKLANNQIILGKNMNVAGAQVAALVAGYKAMDQNGKILGNDMNALAAQTGLADTKVSSLNQAWDQFLSNATGLTSGFAGLTTDIGEINNAITTSGKKFDVFGGAAVSSTQEAAYALKGFSGVGAQVWQNYDAALQQAEQYTDSLRIAATTGTIGQKAFTQQIAYTAQQLLPYARYSQAAAAQLGVLVQEAGGPAVHSYAALKEWIDKNTESTKQFNKQTVAETTAMSDATSVAQDYASTLDSSVAAALQSATISSANLAQKAQNLDSAWTNAGNHISGPVVGAFRQLVSSLTQVYGNTKTAESVADAYMRQQGATAGQVAALNKQIAGTVAWLARIHNPPPVTITVNGVITGSGWQALSAAGVSSTTVSHVIGPGGQRLQTGAQYASAGVALVGEAGPELVRFGGGEQVVPSWQTAAAMHGGGGDGTLNFSHQSTIQVNGTKLGNVTRTQSLTYSRRNPSNNLSLRNR